MTLQFQNLRGYRFGPFEVSLETGELRRNGRRVRLQHKPFQILVALLEQCGKLVGRESLRQRLWPVDTFVDFDNGLNTALSKLREALGDTAEKPRYIETLERRGYRFIAAAEEFGTQPGAQLRELEVQRKRIEPDVVLVEIVGKVVFGSECQQIEWLTAELLGEGQRKIIFDISRVHHLDSTGVGIIVMCSGKAKEAGGQLRVAGAEGHVKTVLKITEVGKNGGLTANTARTNLLIDGQPLPWTEWASEFRENMPEPIAKLMDQVAAGAANTENAASIRERLRQIRELFKFSRYRPTPDGKHTIKDDFTNTGGNATVDAGSSAGQAGGGGGRKHNGGRAGDIYALFADVGNTPAEEIGGFADPQVRWVSVRDKTRTVDFLEDRAAKYLPQANTIQANADFRVFTDMIARWRKFYSHIPSAEPTVEAVVKEWFQQQLVETVLGALALRRSGNWSEQEVEELWSEAALTSAVLPRYHVDERIKRSLGGRLGSLKDKEAAS